MVRRFPSTRTGGVSRRHKGSSAGSLRFPVRYGGYLGCFVERDPGHGRVGLAGMIQNPDEATADQDGEKDKTVAAGLEFPDRLEIPVHDVHDSLRASCVEPSGIRVDIENLISEIFHPRVQDLTPRRFGGLFSLAGHRGPPRGRCKYGYVQIRSASWKGRCRFHSRGKMSSTAAARRQLLQDFRAPGHLLPR